MKKAACFILLVCSYWAGLFAASGDVALEGSWTYSFSSNGVTIKGGSVNNDSSIPTIGVYAEVLLSTSKYTGGYFVGYKIASDTVGSIESHTKQSFYDYMSFERKLPRSGYYYVTFALVSFGKIKSYVTWDSPVYFTNQTQKKVDALLTELNQVESNIEICEWQLKIRDGSDYLAKSQEKMRYVQRKYSIELELIGLYDTKTGEHKYFADFVSYERY